MGKMKSAGFAKSVIQMWSSAAIYTAGKPVFSMLPFEFKPIEEGK